LAAPLLMGLVLVSACAQRASLFTDTTPAGPSVAVAVLQSDLLSIDGRIVRLADALTPQPSPWARCAAEALAARQTAARLKVLASDVSAVSVRLTGALDREKHPYAHVLLDGHDPAQVLITDGMAVAPGGQPFDWCGPIAAGYPRAASVAYLSYTGG
jgi:endonuclease YncB( thermonuclease family)